MSAPNQPNQPQFAPNPYAWALVPANPMKNALGTTSLVFGILSLLFSWLPLLLFPFAVFYGLTIAGFIMGIYGIRRVGHRLATNKGVAVAGAATNGVVLAVGASIIMLAIIGGAVN